MGRSLLHLATIASKNAAPQISYLITRCPELVHFNDNVSIDVKGKYSASIV